MGYLQFSKAFPLMGLELMKSIPSIPSSLFYLKLKIIAKYESYFVLSGFELLFKYNYETIDDGKK